jgi:LPXTG-motif cell wall-anchored protein
MFSSRRFAARPAPMRVASAAAVVAVLSMLLGSSVTAASASASAPASPTPVASSPTQTTPAPAPTDHATPTPTEQTSPTPSPEAPADEVVPSTPPADADPAQGADAEAPNAPAEAPLQTPEVVPATPEGPVEDATTSVQMRAPPEARIGILAAGVPETPAEVWAENFEQGLNTTAPSALTAYAGGRYAASPGWSTPSTCTGVLVNYTAAYYPTETTSCPRQLFGGGLVSTLPAREVRRLADVLGQVAAGTTGSASASTPTVGSTAATRGNHALVGYPATAPGATTVAESNAALGITAPGSRYYTLRLHAAAAGCATGAPSLSMSLFTGSTTLLAPFSSPVTPCTLTGPVFYGSSPVLAPTGGVVLGIGDPAITASARATVYTGSSAALLTPAQIASARVRVSNSTTGVGSGFGIDNLRVLDVTPSLDWAFSPSSVPVGTASTLTYTITNTSDLLAKSDWTFTNTLPAGLTVAPAPAVGGTCTQVTGTTFAVTALAGSSSIAVVGGDLAASAASCTVTVNVMASTEATFTNAPANVVTPLLAPEAATLTVTPASRLTVRKNLPARLASTDQFTLSVRSGSTVIASATTTGTATGLQAAQVSRQIVEAGATYTISETPTSGVALGYASAYECTREGTVIAAGSSRSGPLTMPQDDGAEVVCTFTNTLQQPRLFCDSGLFYSLTTNGALVQADGAVGGQATVGSWANVTGANALGVAAGGTGAYALNRSTDAANVLSILKWTPTGGFESLANSAYTTTDRAGTVIPGSIVAGAIDLATGRYLFGKYNNGSFYAWSFTESAPAASRFTYLGSFSAGSAPNGNGDMAFDNRGNLYVLGAATVNNASSAAIFTVTAETLAGAVGGTLAVSTSATRTLNGLDAAPAFGSVNGIAFSPRGTIYLSSSTSTYEFDPTTWTRVAGTPRIDFAATDLASCNSPGTIAVLKNVVGRAASADQFQLTLADTNGTLGTATTAGTGTGRQTAQVGAFPASIGSTLTVSEAMAAGSTSAIGVYTVRLECWTDGIRIANAAATSAAVTMPDRFGANVVCTFFNSPSPVASVTVIKRVLDPATGQSAPAAGWSLGAAAVATAGSATLLPSEAPRQTSDAAGAAVWSVLFGSASSRAALTISEVQQTRFNFVSGTCTVNGTATPVTFTTASGVVSGAITGVGPSAIVVCTLVNQPITSLTLVKTVSSGSVPATDWTLSATAPTGALAGPTGRTATAATTNVPVSPARPYRLAETGTNAAYVQVGAWRCLESTGAEVVVTAAGDVTLRTGTAVTCTVTNATATLTLLKDVTAPSPGFVPSTWTVTATPAALTGATLPTQSRVGAAYDAVAGNAASTFEVRPGHGYTLSEAPTVPGTRLAYLTLRLERLDGSTWTPVIGRSVTAPAAGQSAVYRFVNAPVVGPTLPLTGGVGADAFVIAGGILLALTVAGALIHRRRRGGSLPT